MTPRQRLAHIILQLTHGDRCWREALRLTRAAALGDLSADAVETAEAVRAALRAADAAIATIQPLAAGASEGKAVAA